MESIGILGMFGLCTIDDIRYRKIRASWVCLFGMVGVLLHIFFGKNSIYSMLGGAALGVIFYILSIVTKEKVGKGDALLIGVMGIFLGFAKTLEMIWLASILAGIVGCGLMIIKKKEKNYELPFVPFLLAGYLCILLQGHIGV